MQGEDEKSILLQPDSGSLQDVPNTGGYVHGDSLEARPADDVAKQAAHITRRMLAVTGVIIAITVIGFAVVAFDKSKTTDSFIPVNLGTFLPESPSLSEPKKRVAINADIEVNGQALLTELKVTNSADVSGSLTVGGEGVFTGTVSAATFAGDGSRLNNISAMNCSGCILLQGDTTTAQAGNIHITGSVRAANFFGNFQGDGSRLTNLPGITGNFVSLQSITPGTSQNGHLNVSGTGIFGGNINVGGNITGSGPTSLQNTLNVSGDTSLNNLFTTGNLNVVGLSNFQNNLTVDGALNVGGTVTAGTYNDQTISSSASFTGTLNVQNGYRLAGTAAAGSYLRGNGTDFVSSTIQSGDLPAGSGNYLQNGTTLQTNANFNIQSAASASIGGIIRGAVGQTADLLQLQNGSGNSVFNISPSGVVTSQTFRAGAIQLNQPSFPTLYSTVLSRDDSNNTVLSGGNVYVSGSSITLDGVNIGLTGNVTISSGKTIRLVGGITSLRPAVPAEGMLYYDTTVGQLLTYAGGKWQADRSTATVIVAASNSLNKEKADYVGDGINDQTVINNAIAALPATGGLIQLLDGTYNLTAATTINKPNVTINGAGNSTVIRRMYSSAANEGLINVISSNVTISNLKIDGNKAAYASNTNRGINTSVPLTKILNSSISSTAGVAIFMSGCVTCNNLISDNDISGSNGNAIHLDAGYVTVSNNSIYSNGGHGVLSQSNNGQRQTVSNNKVYSNTGTGIAVGDAGYATVTGNVVENNGAGIGVGNYSTISGNTISNNIGVGIGSGAIHLNISANNVNNNGSDGLRLDCCGAPGSSYSVIDGNSFDGNAGHGIYLYGGNGQTVVSGNKISNSGGTGAFDGIAVHANSPNARLIGNSITDTTGTGFAINIMNAASGAYVSGNTYSGTGASVINDLGIGTVYASQQNTAGDLVAKSASGNYGFGTTAPTAKFHIQGSDDASNTVLLAAGTDTVATGTPSMTLAIKAGAGQTADILQVQNSAGSTLASFDAGGNANVAGLYINRRFDQGSPANGGIYFINGAGTGYVRPIHYDHNAGTLNLSQNLNWTGGAAGFTSLSGDGIGFTQTSGSIYFKGVTSALPLFNIDGNASNQLTAKIKGAASQTADLLQIQNSVGASLFKVGANGSVNIPNGPSLGPTLSISGGGQGGIANATVYINNTQNGYALGVNGAATIGAITAGATDITATNGSVPLTVTNDGNGGAIAALVVRSTGVSGLVVQSGTTTNFSVASNGTTYTNANLGVGDSTPTEARLVVDSGLATSVGQVIRGFTSQSVDLLQFQDSAGTVQTRFNNSGQLYLGSNSYDLHTFKSGSNYGLDYGNGTGFGFALRANGTDILSVLDSNNSPFNFNRSVSINGSGTGLFVQHGATSAQAVSTFRGGSGATGDLLQLQNSFGTVLGRVTATGGLSFQAQDDTTVAGYFASRNIAGNSAAALVLQNPHSGNSAAILQAKDYNGAVVASISREGIVSGSKGSFPEIVGGLSGLTLTASSTNASVGIGVSGSANNSALHVQAKQFNFIGQIIQGLAGQTADLLQAKDSTGATLASIGATGDLTVKNATINGTLKVNGHILSGNTTGITSVAAGAAACTTPTVSINGNDTAGTITVVTGTGCAATGVLATVTFANPYTAAPRVTLTPGNSVAAGLQYYRGSTTTTFTLETGTVPANSTSYVFDYQLIE